jgi:hypothetical protein
LGAFAERQDPSRAGPSRRRQSLSLLLSWFNPYSEEFEADFCLWAHRDILRRHAILIAFEVEADISS